MLNEKWSLHKELYITKTAYEMHITTLFAGNQVDVFVLNHTRSGYSGLSWLDSSCLSPTIQPIASKVDIYEIVVTL